MQNEGFTLNKLEKGIPLPDGGRGKHFGKWITLAREANHGDSFIVKDARQANSCRASFHHNKIKFISRTQPDGTIRFWILKDPIPESDA